MKMFIGLVLVALALNAALALPAGSPADDAEVIDVPRRNRPVSEIDDTDFHDFKGVIDTGAGSGYPFLQPVPHPYAFNLGFFDSFEDIFRRLRTRLWPLATGDASADEDGVFSFKLTPPKDANTTSTVKIVDGHRIEINDTVYGGDHSFFKVRVVNVRPLESGEDGNPATSAPGKNDNSDGEKNEHDDDSDERREPLEKDNKTTNDNEIRDDPEIAVAIEMLPTKNDESDDVTNLNAEFVTDNTLDSGSVEAETNKAQVEESAAATSDMEDVDGDGDGESALVAKLRNEQDDIDNNSSGLVYNEQLTVEGSNFAAEDADNEEEPETADNFNESHDEATTTLEMTKDMNSMQLTQEADAKEERAEKEILDDTAAAAEAELTAELDEETNSEVVDVNDAVNAEFDAESISISHENQNNENEDFVAKFSSMKHSNYAAGVASANKHREDISSSDDEDADDTFTMSKEFNEEWESLAEDLEKKNDRDNDLSNEIDIYESAVPVDLSNDLAVNDIAASQPDFELNPDAEFVDVDGAVITAGSSDQPKFEKLSMDPTSYSDFK